MLHVAELGRDNNRVVVTTVAWQNPDQFVQTFTENLMTYSLGRTREYYDMPTVRRIVHDTAAKDYRFSAIVQGVVKSDQFRMRRVPQPEPVQSARK